jgi:hypothetical protein
LLGLTAIQNLERIINYCAFFTKNKKTTIINFLSLQKVLQNYKTLDSMLIACKAKHPVLLPAFLKTNQSLELIKKTRYYVLSPSAGETESCIAHRKTPGIPCWISS